MNFRYLCQVANSQLTDWGDWVARHMGDWHGLPHKAAFHPDSQGGANGWVPIAPMPRRIALTSQMVEHLPTLYRDALYASYVFVLDPDGRRWTDEEKANILQLKLSVYRHRVGEGRRLIAKQLQ